MSITHKLPYEWQVGLRYTRAGKRSGRNSFISFISMASVAGIALGAAALIIVLSVLAHVEVFDASGAMPGWRASRQEALRNPEVRAAAPFVETQAMLLSDGVMKPVLLRGVDPGQEASVSDVPRHMREGRFDVIAPGSYNIIIGRALATSLDVGVGDRITLLMASAGDGQPSTGTGMGQGFSGATMPRTRPLTVAGIFEAGHFEFDSTLAFANIEDATELAGLGAPSGLRLRLADMQRAPEVAAQLQSSMSGELFIRDWSKVNAMWFAAVQSQKRMMFIILTMIVAVAAFNLVSTLVMTVRDKQSDIAILRTLGASPRSIMTIFMVQGTLVGVLGALLGVGLGVLVALNIDVIVPFIERSFNVQFLSQEVYLISEIPSELRWLDVGWIGGVAVLLAFLATLYPSWSASRVKPAEALRYE